jgi:hypothetical protein
MRDAKQVAGILGGANVLVLSGPSTDVVRVDLGAEGYEAASVWIAVRDGAPDPEDVRRAVDALFEGRSVDFAGPHPIAQASWRDELAPTLSLRAPVAAAAEVDPMAYGGLGATRANGTPRLRGQRIGGWSLFGRCGEHRSERRASRLARRIRRSAHRSTGHSERSATLERRARRCLDDSRVWRSGFERRDALVLAQLRAHPLVELDSRRSGARAHRLLDLRRRHHDGLP